MLVLGMDSSAKTASVGICDDEKLIVNFTLNHKHTHSEKLLEMVDMALKTAQLDITDIDAFAITKGPGSFTGLRIGLSTVKGLCHALDKPCYTTSTLSMLYENVYKEYEDALIVPMMDARRSEVYTAVFDKEKRLTEDLAIPVCELFEIIDGFCKEKNVVFTGDGVLPNIDAINKHFGKRAQFASEDLIYGSGYAVIKAALKEKNPLKYDEVLPSYLRLSQAERLKKEN